MNSSRRHDQDIFSTEAPDRSMRQSASKDVVVWETSAVWGNRAAIRITMNSFCSTAWHGEPGGRADGSPRYVGKFNPLS